MRNLKVSLYISEDIVSLESSSPLMLLPLIVLVWVPIFMLWSPYMLCVFNESVHWKTSFSSSKEVQIMMRIKMFFTTGLDLIWPSLEGMHYGVLDLKIIISLHFLLNDVNLCKQLATLICLINRKCLCLCFSLYWMVRAKSHITRAVCILEYMRSFSSQVIYILSFKQEYIGLYIKSIT